MDKVTRGSGVAWKVNQPESNQNIFVLFFYTHHHFRVSLKILKMPQNKRKHRQRLLSKQTQTPSASTPLESENIRTAYNNWLLKAEVHRIPEPFG